MTPRFPTEPSEEALKAAWDAYANYAEIVAVLRAAYAVEARNADKPEINSGNADLTELSLDAKGREWATVARELADLLRPIFPSGCRCIDCEEPNAALARFDSLSGETPE